MAHLKKPFRHGDNREGVESTVTSFPLDSKGVIAKIA
jgi:hypothetical protein